MKKIIVCIFLSISIGSTNVARADIWGADVAVLAQILVQAIEQLAQLKAILQNGSDTLGLLQDINRGINDSLGLMRTISPYVSPGVYGDLKKVEDVLRKFSDIYGIVVASPDAKAQASVDQSVAEAVTMNSSIHDYTKQIDQIGEDIKSFSHSVSPGGAQKLTAESLGVVIHVLTQSLRAQGTLLKLQAQSIAMFLNSYLVNSTHPPRKSLGNSPGKSCQTPGKQCITSDLLNLSFPLNKSATYPKLKEPEKP